jgi:type II secretory pathway predicted ATPase ExeA
MDVARFGLRQRPFPATPDTVCYYPATGHEQALNRLLRGLADGEGILVLTGEPGTGKTLLCHRLLGNLEARSGKALQVVLVGQPSLLTTLRQPELTALRQRVVVRAELSALNVDEAADYLLHHVRIAGGRPEAVLLDEAVEVLARQTQGVPRLINQAAHEAMCLAEGAGATQVDAEAALEALALLGLEASGDSEDEESSEGATAEGEDVGRPPSRVLAEARSGFSA